MRNQCYDHTICILSIGDKNEIIPILFYLFSTDLEKSCLTVQTCFLTDWCDHYHALWNVKTGDILVNIYTVHVSQVQRHSGKAKRDCSIYSRYNSVSWHYVFYLFGPGIYKTKPLTLQCDKRAVLCFELIAVCLYFLFTSKHCGKTNNTVVRGQTVGKLHI